MPLPAGAPWWATWVLVVLFGTGGIGFMAYLARPTKETIEDLRGEIEKLRTNDKVQDTKIDTLQRDNALLGNWVTALTMHSDGLRQRLLIVQPNVPVETASEVLHRVQLSFMAQQTGILAGSPIVLPDVGSQP